jgi:AraC family transcriptional regulator
VHDGFTERWSLAELAAAASVSADHLARAFRRHQGCTVGEYVRRLRVELACRLLAESEEPLAQVALAAGFSDQSHFTKVFRRRMGTTPAAFRKLQRPRRSRTTA